MDLTPNELVETVVHQAHVIRRLEVALADHHRVIVQHPTARDHQPPVQQPDPIVRVVERGPAGLTDLGTPIPR